MSDHAAEQRISDLEEALRGRDAHIRELHQLSERLLKMGEMLDAASPIGREARHLRQRLQSTPLVPPFCSVHQHYKWCGHNGGVWGNTGHESPIPEEKEFHHA